MSGKKKDKTIFREILLPLLSMLALEMLFMAGTILAGGVIDRLNQNAMDILAQQTENRGNYLLNEMIGNWSNLELLSEEIDEKVQERLAQGLLSYDDLNTNNAQSTELLKEIAPSLVNTLYNKQITGIYVVFNTRAGGNAAQESAPGIYLRDLDPLATPSRRYADLLWERAPVGVVQSGYITTDAGWQPNFSEEDMEKPFFSKPFLTAYTDDRGLAQKEYGYWTTRQYSLSGDSQTALSYSVPLISEDGTVYGVLGVELLTDYMESLLPESELLEGRQGSYLLALAPGEGQPLIPIILSSRTMTPEQIAELRFVLSEKGTSAADTDGKYYGAAKKLTLYSNNAPFDTDKWYLLGISSRKSLFAFSRQIQALLAMTMVLTFIVGLSGIFLASYRLSKPIQRLSGEVEKAQQDNRMPELPATGIREIDQFAALISRLGREVVESSTRLLGIMNMASVELAGYELQDASDSVYVTDNFFPMLGACEIDAGCLTPEEFGGHLQKLHRTLEHTCAEDGSITYSVPQSDGSIRYLRFEQQKKDGRQIGLIEDVTVSTLEKKRIELERDSDGLTRLYARRGFRREADALFLKPAVLKHAALLMMDLDNLKTTNDRFGHNVGDQYIQTAGRCFLENTPENTLCARISGDEFILLFYGYDSREAVREQVKILYHAIHTVDFILPNGDNMGISASGGVAWYPEDSMQLSELMKYADFAMYQVKRSQKGNYQEFARELFDAQQLQDQRRLEFHQILADKDINYFFQPIFESKKGEVFAYEALMRVNLPSLRSPDIVMSLAREENCMHDIEYLTMFRSSECYDTLLKKNAVAPNALLFINSIANECMTEQEESLYRELYGHLQSRVVIEITEAEHMDMELIRRKSRVKGFSGMFALDDYGSGYNSEVSLLELKPKFVKVDISIVRDVDKDANKQQIISNIVNYGHKRDMMILAEGLETPEELKKVLELGVDLLQGYFLARPGEVPPEINREALALIRREHEQTMP